MDGDDFQARVNRNLEDNKALAARLMSEFKSYASKTPLSKEKTVRKSRVKVVDRSLLEPRRNPSRSVKKTASDNNNRSGYYSEGNTATSEKEINSGNTGKRFIVKFQGYHKTRLRLGADASASDENNNNGEHDVDEIMVFDDEDDSSDGFRRRKSAPSSISYEVSELELKLVATCTSVKVYDQANGTSCHQCRQKTLDTKTVCRSGKCVGVRGMFCGPCLKNRYGEDATEALKDKDWCCPPCRGMCNCSICRRRSGKTCTGILVHTARQQGFNDVSSYLNHLSS